MPVGAKTALRNKESAPFRAKLPAGPLDPAATGTRIPWSGGNTPGIPLNRNGSTYLDSQPADLLPRLAALDSGQVADVLLEAGYPGQVLHSDLAHRAGGRRFAGLAACVSGTATPPTADRIVQKPPFAIDDGATPDTVLLLGTGGFTAGALVGGFVVRTLMAAGCRALVTDGAVRDVEEIDGLGFPVVARCVTSGNGYRQWVPVARGETIRLPGQHGGSVAVAPGDYVLGDADGVVVVPARLGPQVVPWAEELAAIEKKVGEALSAGFTRSEAFKLHPRFAHIRRLD